MSPVLIVLVSFWSQSRNFLITTCTQLKEDTFLSSPTTMIHVVIAISCTHKHKYAHVTTHKHTHTHTHILLLKKNKFIFIAVLYRNVKPFLKILIS
jgi:hypothetical protein